VMCKSLAPCFTQADSNLSIRIVPMFFSFPSYEPADKPHLGLDEQTPATDLLRCGRNRVVCQRRERLLQADSLAADQPSPGSLFSSPSAAAPSHPETREMTGDSTTATHAPGRNATRTVWHRQIFGPLAAGGDLFDYSRKCVKTQEIQQIIAIASARLIPLLIPLGDAEDLVDGRGSLQHFANAVVVKC
jgi:hypothetical protein